MYFECAMRFEQGLTECLLMSQQSVFTPSGFHGKSLVLTFKITTILNRLFVVLFFARFELKSVKHR